MASAADYEADIPTLRRILAESRTIAVVGLSQNWHRPSNFAAKYLQHHGYRIIPVNPLAAGKTILGEPCYATLMEAAAAIAAQGGEIDIVNVFRRSEDIPPVLEQVLAIKDQVKLKVLWLQQGISHAASEQAASAAGLEVVSDACIKTEHCSANL